MEKNTAPKGALDLLRALLRCNKTQLAARLGVTIHTLRVWERDGLSDNGRERCKQLFGSVLNRSDCEWISKQTPQE